MEILLNKKVQALDKFPILKIFEKVKIKDSVCFQLPEEYKDKYRGSGGAGSKSSARIQFEYDLLTSKIEELNVTSFNNQDISNAKSTFKYIHPKELIIRDLGYTSVEILMKIDQVGAFYISRLNNKLNVYEKIDKNYKEIDLCELEKSMRKKQQMSIEKSVYLFKDKKTKCRIIIELLPEEIKNQRIRKRYQTARRKGRNVSKRARERDGLNIYITNVEQDIIPSQFIRPIYGIRWQIEMIFKVWKSVGQIHKIKKMSIYRFEFYLYSKIIFLVINWHITTLINRFSIKRKGINISLFKVLKAMYISGPDKIQELVFKLLYIIDGEKFVNHSNREKRVNKYLIKQLIKTCV